jgi:tetratricopeptide (TPR) repeat protein
MQGKDVDMTTESWVTVFRSLSYVGVALIAITTIGTSVLQARVNKAKDQANKTKDQKIDTLLEGNKELLAKNDELAVKVTQYQQDLQTKDTRIKELEVKAKKAGRGITSMYGFRGERRTTAAGNISVEAGDETAIFQQMFELEKKKTYSELIVLCEEQIKKTPTWLTPYLYLGVAHANTGNREKAISNLEHVVAEAPDDPAYAEAVTFLERLKKQ